MSALTSLFRSAGGVEPPNLASRAERAGRATPLCVDVTEGSADADPAAEPQASSREVHYEASREFVPILSRLGASLLVSTYQAGKLVTIGVDSGRLSLSFHNFEQAMGVAAAPGRLAVGTRHQVWLLHSAPHIATRLEPAGRHDDCFLARSSYFTSDINVHELAWAGGELWAVNTLFSCLCTLGADFSFVPRWRPPFISALAAEDRCHLNGVAFEHERARYVTALGETDTPQGWRPGKASGGCLIDVDSGRTIIRGLCMPHSPRLHRGRLWLLDSGTGRLVVAGASSGTVQGVAGVPGYARGMDCHGQYAFVGLSRIRETSIFGGIPIAERREQLKCGVAVIDLAAGRAVASLEFKSGVEEIFAVTVLPGTRCPAISGPFAHIDGAKSIWNVPDPQQSAATAEPS
jgi:uncharacterized protein (TIGR03032 family)